MWVWRPLDEKVILYIRASLKFKLRSQISGKIILNIGRDL